MTTMKPMTDEEYLKFGSTTQRIPPDRETFVRLYGAGQAAIQKLQRIEDEKPTPAEIDLFRHREHKPVAMKRLMERTGRSLEEARGALLEAASIDWKAKYEEEHRLRCDLERRFDARLDDNNQDLHAARRLGMGNKPNDTPETADMRTLLLKLLQMIRALKAQPVLESRAINLKEAKNHSENHRLEIDFGLDEHGLHAMITDAESCREMQLEPEEAERVGEWLIAAAKKVNR